MRIFPSQNVKKLPHVSILSSSTEIGNAIEGGGNFGSFDSQGIRGGGNFGSFDSQGIRGGGNFGSLDGQGIRGGGTVSSITWNSGNDVTGSDPWTTPGFFVKVPSAPANKTTLFDFNFGIGGYLRVYLDTNLHVVIEAAVGGTSGSVDSIVPIPTGSFVFVSFAISSSNLGVSHLSLKVTAPGGIVLFSYLAQPFGVLPPATTFSSTVGWGVSVSSSYDNFPNTTGWELSKLLVENQTSVFALPVPSVDFVPDVNTLIYCNCRQTVGAIGTVTDSSGHGNNLTAGSLGATCVLPGPYA